jgi:WD40 repeat protein
MRDDNITDIYRSALERHRTFDRIPAGFKLRRTLGLKQKLASDREGSVQRDWIANQDWIEAMAWSPDGRRIAACYSDHYLRIWDAEGGYILRQLFRENYVNYGDTRDFICNTLAWSPDGLLLACGGSNGAIEIWDTESGHLARTLELKSGVAVYNLSWFSNRWDTLLAAGSSDKVIRLWLLDKRDLGKGRIPRLVLEKGGVMVQPVIKWSPAASMIVSGGEDKTVSIWTVSREEKRREYAYQLEYEVTLRLHNDVVTSLAWSPDGQVIASGSDDRTIQIINPYTGFLLYVLEGHTSSVVSVSFSPDGRLLASMGLNGSIHLWRCDTWDSVTTFADPIRAVRSRAAINWSYSDDKPLFLPGAIFNPQVSTLAIADQEKAMIQLWDLEVDEILGGQPSEQAEQAIHYTNAKVVLVGDTGVGKSGLALVLTNQPFAATSSSHNRRVWTLDYSEVGLEDGVKEIREILLWDLAGQPGYRVFHRQHLNDVAVALVLFDSRSETEPFAGVAYWARALDEASKGFPMVKLLVAARIDRGGPQVGDDRILGFCTQYGFEDIFQVSAQRGDGIGDLARAINGAITWSKLPHVSSSKLFYRMKAFVLLEKKAGRVLQRRLELLERYLSSHEVTRASEDAFNTSLGRLEATGLIKRMTFGELILLQPELIDDYSAWIALSARDEPDGLGFIPERRTRAGDFKMDENRSLRNTAEEQLLITATIEDLVGRGIALRQPTEKGEMLIFPSEMRVDIPDYPGDYVRTMAFHFEGPVKATYAILAVCLAHTTAFVKEAFFRNAAVYRSASNEVCGFTIDYPDYGNDALGRLTVFFDTDVSRTTKLLFLRYVNQQLKETAFDGKVQQERVYYHNCGYPKPIMQDDVDWRRKQGHTTVICPGCGSPLPIDDLAEQSAQSDQLVEEQLAQSVEELSRQKRLAVFAERERGDEYHVFLCHNSKDKRDVRILARQLRAQGILPWLDEEGILAGQQFAPELERVIDTVRSVAVIIGPHSLGRWQKQEYYAFLQRFVEHREEKESKLLTIIPVYLPGTPPEVDLPAFLRGFNRVDFQKEGGLENHVSMSRLVRAILAEPLW